MGANMFFFRNSEVTRALMSTESTAAVQAAGFEIVDRVPMFVLMNDGAAPIESPIVLQVDGKRPFAPNHGPGHDHILTITVAEITADQTKTYSTKGMADHDHIIQITAADFTALASGKELRKPSCNEDHEHEYIINCLGTDGVGNPNVAAFCGDATMPNNRTCGESTTHTCPDTPYPTS